MIVQTSCKRNHVVSVLSVEDGDMTLKTQYKFVSSQLLLQEPLGVKMVQNSDCKCIFNKL
jgi:hypothetical protein